MVFIDADKDNYINYYNFILDNNLLRMRGVICVDNTLFKSKVYLNDVTDGNGLALRRFNQFVSADPRVEQVAFFFARSLIPQLHQQQLFLFNSSSSSFHSPMPVSWYRSGHSSSPRRPQHHPPGTCDLRGLQGAGDRRRKKKKKSSRIFL